ncbi:helix-turn-helix transcriptional regulator [Streptomyces abyssomicinicus]|uniref:helix-turn-helix transcriptional regulator n=1 Tax=Streptomyces abyssomicinicus TaxID=574929 RepID=UPI0013E07CD4|nr:AAA family ATPase [Streptomyces abyssomicinicus]
MTQRYVDTTNPLVGRDAELEQIGAALAAARAGRGAAVFVTGEPGAGRTRLAAEAVAAARADGMACAQGRAGTVAARVPYRPLVEAVLALARQGLVPDPDRHEPLLTRLLSGTADAGAGGLPHLAVADAVLRLVAEAGRDRGCLLVLDDLHDTDPGTTAVVEYLLDNIGRQPATLLLTTAHIPCPATELAARARQHGSAVTLHLRPLDRAGIRALLAAGPAAGPAGAAAGLVDQVLADSAGIPFVVTECLAARREPELPVAATAPGAPAPVPPAVIQNVRCRATALGPAGVAFLSTAALLGEPLVTAVAQRAVGCDDRETARILRAAAASYLIVQDGTACVFRHRLVGRALLADLGPGARAGYARRAALAVEELHPGLPGRWCDRAAHLYAQAGDLEEAVRLYCLAAERATGADAADRAVTLLERARHHLGPDTAPQTHATVLEHLLDAVTRAARLDLLPGLTAAVDDLGEWDLPAGRRAGLHARLAIAAALTGRSTPALRSLDLARPLHDTCPDHPDAALVDLATAHVEPLRLTPRRLRTAVEAAHRALEAARRTDRPALACRALLALGRLTADSDEPAATRHLEDAAAMARAHRLPALRVAADVALAALAMRRDGRTEPLERAHQESLRLGVVPLAHEASLLLALEEIRRCEFTAAGNRIRAGLADAARRGLGQAVARFRLAEAVGHAHLGSRPRMLEALERLTPGADGAPGTPALEYGLARAFCALLEERREDAEQDLARALACDAENPAAGDFGRYGLCLLLGVLTGRAGRGHHTEAVAVSVADTRWNRSFAAMTDAVLLGREGRPAEATAAARTALDAARPYPTARHLIVRLVAREAYENGWGTPVDWLREAEAYFHDADVPAVAGACRALLRGMGAPVGQRRRGVERVPRGLRRYGITVREFEVARLLAERIGTKDIAGLMHISPRTVEKHVASLLQKTGHPNRSAFVAATRDLVLGGRSQAGAGHLAMSPAAPLPAAPLPAAPLPAAPLPAAPPQAARRLNAVP